VSRAAIRERVEELGPWFHDLDLGGVRTAPDHPLGGFLDDLWTTVRSYFPEDMGGRSVLDIGCNAGFYTFQLCRRGAEVTGIDHDGRYLAQARLASELLGLDAEFREMEAYDVQQLGRTFDYVLFMGVLYHLRHPLLALDRISPIVKGKLVFQTLVRGSDRVFQPAEDYPISEEEVFEEPGFPAMYFIERRYANDPTNWWVPNAAAVEGMLRSAGFAIDANPARGVYICSPAAA